MSESSIQRHRTALTRHELSRPLKVALGDGLIVPESTMFDYGCGRGDDVRLLRQRGWVCSGWDPAHRPNAKKSAADIVNLGFVVNVIEDATERADALKSAWQLTNRALIVSARLVGDARGASLLPHQDGFLTGANTFQKYFEQHELREWIDAVLGTAPIAAAPGIYYVFRDEAIREEFVASRFRRQRAAPRLRQSDRLFAEHRGLLDPLIGFLNERGRLPGPDELASESEIVDVFGSLKRAALVLRRAMDTDAWESIRRERREDLLVYLALSRFSRRPKFSRLSRVLQLDLRAFFSTYKHATGAADELLYSIGDMETVDAACRDSTIGKLMPSAIYVHKSAIPSLPPPLRVYEGCARNYLGDVDDTNVVKLNRMEPKVSYLAYPEFDQEPHPALSLSVSVRLQTFQVRERNFQRSSNPPILHRKEKLVNEEYPLHEKFARLTAQEERYGLYENPSEIGTRDGWHAELERRGVALRGHRLIRSR